LPDFGKALHYCYDEHRNLLSEESPDGKVRILSYDERGNAVSIQNPGQGSIDIVWNEMDLPVSARQPNGGLRFVGDLTALSAGSWNAAFKRDETSLEIERLLPGNLKRQMERDSIGRVTRQEMVKNYTNIEEKSYL
jgi:YD repeat-containing protein